MPKRGRRRAAISAEMHSGFATLRNDMSMDLLNRLPSPPISAALAADIERSPPCGGRRAPASAKAVHFLFGAFTNADAMYAPVATRFRTYGVDLSSFGDDGRGASYMEAIFALPAMAEWTKGAAEEVKAST